MSYTELYAAGEDGDLKVVQTFKNSHGSAMMIWSALVAAHMPEGFIFDQIPKLWDDPSVQVQMAPWERQVLWTTYDDVVVKRDDMLKVAGLLRQFKKAYHNPKHVCHLGSQAYVIEKAHADGAIAIAWHQTSTAETHWRIYLEEQDEERPFNVLTDTDFQYIDFDSVTGGLR